MVVNTAGHWTTGVFSKIEPPGMEGVLNLFEAATEQWAERLQSALRADAVRRRNSVSFLSTFLFGLKKQKERRAVVRAYLPGHDNCHDYRHPWNEIQPSEYYSWNWGDIPKFNSIFEVRFVTFLGSKNSY